MFVQNIFFIFLYLPSYSLKLILMTFCLHKKKISIKVNGLFLMVHHVLFYVTYLTKLYIYILF